MRKILNKMFSTMASKPHSQSVQSKPNPIHQWEEDKAFLEILSTINNTLVDKVRCFMLYQFSKQVLDMEGAVAEIGVYKGGTAKLFSQVFKGKKEIHLFDTFLGMPETDPVRDVHKTGDFDDTTLEDVKNFLGEAKNVHFHKGFFPDTSGPVKDKKFCFVHVDVDIYRSVLDCCDFFYPRLTKGGIMVFDDYGFLSCPGAKMGVDEFFSGKPEYPCYLPTGQAFIIKK